jgi:hypothetical protein
MSNDNERIRSIGRRLEDLRGHLTVIKNEAALVEQEFELALNDLADLVKRADGRD